MKRLIHIFLLYIYFMTAMGQYSRNISLKYDMLTVQLNSDVQPLSEIKTVMFYIVAKVFYTALVFYTQMS